MRCLVPVCLAALVACNGHRYGFFGNEEGEGGASSTGADTSQSPTTGPPVTTSPDPTITATSPDPTITATSPDPTITDPTITDPTITDPTITDPTITDPTVPDPTTTGPSTLSDSGDPSSATTFDTTSAGTSETTGGSQVCNEVVLEPVVPQSVFAGNFGNPDLFQPSCAMPDAGELVFVWQAPFAGVFQFDTFTSTFNTILAVFGDFCGGPELACNDDFDGLTSALGVELAAGQVVTVVVEGFKGAEGNVMLNIKQVDTPPIPCSALDLGMVSDGGGAAGSTALADDLRSGTCGGAGAPELGFRWQPPHSGTFRFRGTGFDFDPVLYIRGGGCNEPELACNNDFDGLNSQIDLALAPEDGPIFVYLDAIGPGGNFEFTITEM